MLHCPDCPTTSNELENLLYSLTDSEVISFNASSLREVEIREEASALAAALPWGETRQKAFNNYVRNHFLGLSLDHVEPCEQCISLYRELLSRRARELAEEKGIDPVANAAAFRDLIDRANEEYLGVPEQFYAES
jgi:hypothetical protein